MSATRAASRRISTLLDLVLRREPVPHRNIERSAGRVAEIADALRALRGELRRVDAVGVVERKIGQVGGARRGHSKIALVQRCQRALQLRIVLRRGSLDIGARGQRRRRCRGRQRIRRTRIGEEQHAEIEARFLRLHDGVGQIALALLLLKLRLHHVGVGGFAGGLALLGQRDEAVGFAGSALGDGNFVLAM